MASYLRSMLPFAAAVAAVSLLSISSRRLRPPVSQIGAGEAAERERQRPRP